MVVVGGAAQPVLSANALLFSIAPGCKSVPSGKSSKVHGVSWSCRRAVIERWWSLVERGRVSGHMFSQVGRYGLNPPLVRAPLPLRVGASTIGDS